MGPPTDHLTRPSSGTSALKRSLERRSAEHKEDVARWKKDHPGREPGTSLKTWKSYSRIRYASEAFRDGYEKISWK